MTLATRDFSREHFLAQRTYPDVAAPLKQPMPAPLHCFIALIKLFRKHSSWQLPRGCWGFFLSTSIQAHSLPWQNEEMEAEKLKGCYQIQVCNTKVYFLSESKEFASFRSYNHLSFYSHSPAFSFSFCFLSVSFFLYFHRL